MLTRSVRSLLCVAVLAVAAGRAPAEAPAESTPKAEPPKGTPRALTVYPAKITLDGPRDGQHLGVLAEYGDGRAWDFRREARYGSSAPAVAVVDAHGVVRPVGDGAALITVSAAGKTATVAVQ